MNAQRRSFHCTQWNISHGKEWNSDVCNTIERPRDNHTTWSNEETERQISYDITFRFYLKIDTHELISKTRALMDEENKIIFNQMERCEACIN